MDFNELNEVKEPAETKKKFSPKILLIAVLAICVLAAGIFIGYSAGNSSAQPATYVSDKDFVIPAGNYVPADNSFTDSYTYYMIESIMEENFGQFDPDLIYDDVNQVLILVVAAPDGTSDALRKGQAISEWNAVCENMATVSEAGKEAILSGDFPDDFAVAITSDKDSSVILYSALNGREATCEFVRR